MIAVEIRDSVLNSYDGTERGESVMKIFHGNSSQSLQNMAPDWFKTAIQGPGKFIVNYHCNLGWSRR